MMNYPLCVQLDLRPDVTEIPRLKNVLAVENLPVPLHLSTKGDQLLLDNGWKLCRFTLCSK